MDAATAAVITTGIVGVAGIVATFFAPTWTQTKLEQRRERRSFRRATRLVAHELRRRRRDALSGSSFQTYSRTRSSGGSDRARTGTRTRGCSWTAARTRSERRSRERVRPLECRRSVRTISGIDGSVSSTFAGRRGRGSESSSDSAISPPPRTPTRTSFRTKRKSITPRYSRTDLFAAGRV